MKVRDHVYVEETLAQVMSNPVVAVNFENLKKDFEACYDGFLSQEIMTMTDSQISDLKTDIFLAYIMGCVQSMDVRSFFRIGFRVPQEAVVEKKPDIFMGEEKKILNPPKLIL